MSLNGLDGTEINHAYQTALAEAGGWWVIHFVNLMIRPNPLPEQVSSQIHI